MWSVNQIIEGPWTRGAGWDGPQFCISNQPGLLHSPAGTYCIVSMDHIPSPARCPWDSCHLWPLFCDHPLSPTEGLREPPASWNPGHSRPLSSWQVLSRVSKWDKRQSKGLWVRLAENRQQWTKLDQPPVTGARGPVGTSPNSAEV